MLTTNMATLYECNSHFTFGNGHSISYMPLPTTSFIHNKYALIDCAVGILKPKSFIDNKIDFTKYIFRECTLCGTRKISNQITDIENYCTCSLCAPSHELEFVWVPIKAFYCRDLRKIESLAASVKYGSIHSNEFHTERYKSLLENEEVKRYIKASQELKELRKNEAVQAYVSLREVFADNQSTSVYSSALMREQNETNKQKLVAMLNQNVQQFKPFSAKSYKGD